MRTPTLIAATLIATVIQAAGADGPPSSQWIRYWDEGPTGPTTGGLTVSDAVGNVYVIGSVTRASEDLVVLKYSPAGALLFDLVYDGPGHGNESVTDAALTDEGLAVVAASPGTGGPETVLLDVSAAGEIMREVRTIGPDFPGFLRPQIAIGADGRRVIGTDDNAGHALVAAYDDEGRLLFENDYTLSGFSGVSALEVDASNHTYVVFVEGFSTYVVRVLDPDGNELWTHSERGGTGLILSEAQIALAGNGDATIAGTFEIACEATITNKARVWRHDSEGNVLWTRDHLGACDFGIATDLLAYPDDGVVLAARGDFLTSFITRIHPDGTTAWTRELGGNDDSVGVTDLALAGNGSVIVGSSIAPIEDIVAFDFLVQCFDGEGTLAWQDVFAGPGDEADFLADVAVGGDGGVTVVGTVRDVAPVQSFVTIHYGFDDTCPADLDDDGAVGFGDLLALLGAWGSNEGHPADLDGDGVVAFGDLLTLLSAWGPCPA